MKTFIAALTAASLALMLVHPAFCLTTVVSVLAYLTLDLMEVMQV